MKIIKKVKKFLIGGDDDNTKVVSRKINQGEAYDFERNWYNNETTKQMLSDINKRELEQLEDQISTYKDKLSSPVEDRVNEGLSTDMYLIENRKNVDGTVNIPPRSMSEYGVTGTSTYTPQRQRVDAQGNPLTLEQRKDLWHKEIIKFYNNSNVKAFYNSKDKNIYINPEYLSDTSTQVHELDHSIQDKVPETLETTKPVEYKLKEEVKSDSYLDNKKEIRSRIMQLRYEAGLNPDKRDYESKDVQELYKKINPELKSELSRMDDQTVADYLNYMAYNNNSNFNRFSNNENQNIQLAKLGMIKIKPENKGKFTEKANKRGLGVQEFANQILNNKENYNTSTIKQANFARNANKWNKKKLGWNNNDSSTGKQNKSVEKFKDGGISYLDYNPGIIGAGINALGNIGGSIASYFTNKKFLDKMETPKEPLMLQHNKRITKVNINPQLREIKNSADRLQKSVVDNTASASKTLKALREIESSKVDKLAGIYAQKENMENALINQDITARSEIDKYNLEQANKYRESVRDFYNKKYDLQSENTQGLISGLTGSINSIISEIGQNRAQKDSERMILAKSDINAEEAKDKGLSVAPAWDIQMQKRREERKQRRVQRKNKDNDEE